MKSEFLERLLEAGMKNPAPKPKGTPKTLHEAVVNGIRDHHWPKKLQREDELARAVIPHVMDFLAQKFTSGYLSKETTQQLWRRIFAEVGIDRDGNIKRKVK